MWTVSDVGSSTPAAFVQYVKRLLDDEARAQQDRIRQATQTAAQRRERSARTSFWVSHNIAMPRLDPEPTLDAPSYGAPSWAMYRAWYGSVP